MSTAYIQTHTQEAHDGDIFAVAVSEKYTASAAGDGDLVLWNNASKQSHSLGIHNKSGIHHIALNDHYISAVYFDGSVSVWALSNYEKVTFDALSAVKSAWDCALSIESNTLVITTISAKLYIFNLDSGHEVNTIDPQAQLIATCVDITVDASFVAVGLESGKVSVFSVESGNLAYTLPLHTMSPRSVKFSPMGSLVAVAGNVDAISLYSLNGGDLIGTLNGHTSWIFSLSWSETGEFLLSVSHDTTAKIWSIESRSCVSTLRDSSQPLFSGAFIKNGWAPAFIGGTNKGIVTAGVDRTLRWYREAAGAS